MTPRISPAGGMPPEELAQRLHCLLSEHSAVDVTLDDVRLVEPALLQVLAGARTEAGRCGCDLRIELGRAQVGPPGGLI
jgi:hypothetical protein